MEAAIAFHPCRTVGGRAKIGFVPAVLDPFRDVSGRVVKTEGIRLVRANGSRLSVGPGPAVAAIGFSGAGFVAPPEPPAGTSSGCIFPLGLG